NFDDPLLVVDNPAVKGGLTLSGIVWAFSAPRLGNYNPITWLSHMLDVQIFGMWAGGHHLMNLFFHLLAPLLRLGVLLQLRAGPGPAWTGSGLSPGSCSRAGPRSSWSGRKPGAPRLGREPGAGWPGRGPGRARPGGGLRGCRALAGENAHGGHGGCGGPRDRR